MLTLAWRSRGRPRAERLFSRAFVAAAAGVNSGEVTSTPGDAHSNSAWCKARERRRATRGLVQKACILKKSTSVAECGCYGSLEGEGVRTFVALDHFSFSDRLGSGSYVRQSVNYVSMFSERTWCRRIFPRTSYLSFKAWGVGGEEHHEFALYGHNRGDAVSSSTCQPCVCVCAAPRPQASAPSFLPVQFSQCGCWCFWQVKLFGQQQRRLFEFHLFSVGLSRLRKRRCFYRRVLQVYGRLASLFFMFLVIPRRTP